MRPIDETRLSRRGQIRIMRETAERALASYRIEPVSLSLIQHFDNTTFRVTDPDRERYVLHIRQQHEDVVSPTQRRARVESELWWLDRVRADLQLSVPTAVCAPTGERVVAVGVEGRAEPLLSMLFHWVDGRFLYHRLTPAHLEAVGLLTARLHNNSTGLHIPPSFDRPTVDAADAETEERVTRLFADHFSHQAAELMRRVLRRVRQAQDDLGAGREVFGLIHADIHQKNYLFKDGEVRLIDFGDCGWGHYLYDLAVTVHQVQALPHRTELRKALLTGYRQMRDLSPAHEALIDAFVMLREAQDLTYVLEERDNPAYSKWTAQIETKVAMLEGRLAAEG